MPTAGIFAWGTHRRFNDYSSYIRRQFGGRVQKISVNVGLSCPNRDGIKGYGGCIYCDNSSFTPTYCDAADSVPTQLAKGRAFFSKKYPDMRYVAYFQSYTNTYAPSEVLSSFYQQAIDNGIVGLVIGTRPDCVNNKLLAVLERINSQLPVMVEFGIESTNDTTLERINRHHTWQCSVDAISKCHERGLQTGGHLILGLPGESEVDYIRHAQLVSELPLQTLKLHQLQIIRGTQLARQFEQNPDIVQLFSLDKYLHTVISFMEHLKPEIVMERFVSVSPADKLIAPKWNRMKNFEVVALIDKELERLNTWQGRLYDSNE